MWTSNLFTIKRSRSSQSRFPLPQDVSAHRCQSVALPGKCPQSECLHLWRCQNANLLILTLPNQPPTFLQLHFFLFRSLLWCLLFCTSWKVKGQHLFDFHVLSWQSVFLCRHPCWQWGLAGNKNNTVFLMSNCLLYAYGCHGSTPLSSSPTAVKVGVNT